MLENHVVLVLGGGSGLGRGLVRSFRNEGAEVAVLEVSASKVEELQTEFGDDVLAVQGDVTVIGDLERCRSVLLERFGRLDALVGCVGVFDGNVSLHDTPLDKMPALFDEIFHINVLGNMLATKVFVDLLDQSGGAIVLTTSTAAYAADGGGPTYTASKGAVSSLVNQLGFELAPRIRVNGVAPLTFANSRLRGPAALGMDGWDQSQVPVEDMASAFERLIPLSQMCEPEDYAPVYAFLASRHNKIMTGQSVIADQGMFNRALMSA
ncbi:SDR family oxidoreductase [Mycobacterium deserti]|uniref:SDR family oxidoreductase n=1 Tax=Mycobacterium deserti TaxID=2978347 RepID=A0ABT2MEG9_9MYCO|nr:SDR family oxidoreductase [Mycobacterium deserti]MCT7660664.1 SDR family oxidoreductase [Mycobacterium deserti]